MSGSAWADRKGALMITTTNPRTGVSTPTRFEATSDEQVARIADEASRAASSLLEFPRDHRARLLDAIADEAEARRDSLVTVADQESGLGTDRLNAELSRSIFQFRLFADAVREGSFLESIIDHAAETPIGPGPDLRRMLVPIGPVAVFGASNFPFAFSVLGGDTASALAAGCPVVLKAHSSHPLTSVESFDALQAATERSGMPAGTVSLVLGTRAGTALVSHPAIRAVSLTGSVSAAKALQAEINSREDPIPLYGELSSLNPLIITAGAALSRPESIADGLFASFTGSAGQLCTKPGIAFLPAGEGQLILDRLRTRVEQADESVLLNARIHASFSAAKQRLLEAGAHLQAEGAHSKPDDQGFSASPALLTVDAKHLSTHLTEECFGPLVIAATYRDRGELLEALRHLPSSLTATIHADDDEHDDVRALSSTLEHLAGRLVYNGFPTGVRVSWAQHHGGQWPATNSNHTSVGVTAMRRFMRPFVWQNAPLTVLPEELRDDFEGIPRRVDGVLRLPSSYRSERKQTG